MRLLGIVLHAQRQRDIEYHLRAGRQVGKAVGARVLGIEVQRVGLHEGAGETEHIAGGEGKAARVFEHLSRFQFIQVAAVLGLARFFQRNGNACRQFSLGRQLNSHTHAQLLSRPFPPVRAR